MSGTVPGGSDETSPPAGQLWTEARRPQAWLTLGSSCGGPPGLHRVALHVEPWNRASVRTAERSGHHREGLLQSYTEIGGSRRDMLLFASAR